MVIRYAVSPRLRVLLQMAFAQMRHRDGLGEKLPAATLLALSVERTGHGQIMIAFARPPAALLHR